MSDDAIHRRPLWHTPLRDLARGRVTGRLDWRSRLDASGLPAPAGALIGRVVRGTRLWRLEKAALADELIAHFADGVASNATTDDLVHAFGDERAAARLIRRATIRKRPLAWHAFKWTRRVLLAIAAFYAVVFARFFLARPHVGVDYVARLNAPIERVPVDERAWPLYRKAMLALDVDDRHLAPPQSAESANPLFRFIDPDGDRNRTVVEATPADAAAWATLGAWLDAHAEGLATLRAATARPAMGFVLGPAGSQHDPELGWDFRQPGFADQPMISVLLPTLKPARQLAEILRGDARVAASRGDGSRVADDIAAMLGLARHQGEPIVVSRLVAMGVDSLAFDAVEHVLRDSPGVLTDAQLVALAHRVASVGGDAPASLVDLAAERMSFDDLVQRLYSDDGHGDGVLTANAPRAMSLYGAINGLARGGQNDATTMAAVIGVGPILSTRLGVVDEHERLMSLLDARFARPLRETTNADNPSRRLRDRLREIRASPMLMAKLLPVALLTPDLDRAAVTAERTLGRREGVTVGLALEAYHRRHGDYPPTLDALTPDLLPRVPADRITGEPVKYRLIDGRPIVYSVGVDRDDDGGRAVAGANGPIPSAAAQWPIDEQAMPQFEGDWILFDGRRTDAP